MYYFQASRNTIKHLSMAYLQARRKQIETGPAIQSSCYRVITNWRNFWNIITRGVGGWGWGASIFVSPASSQHNLPCAVPNNCIDFIKHTKKASVSRSKLRIHSIHNTVYTRSIHSMHNCTLSLSHTSRKNTHSNKRRFKLAMGFIWISDCHTHFSWS